MKNIIELNLENIIENIYKSENLQEVPVDLTRIILRLNAYNTIQTLYNEDNNKEFKLLDNGLLIYVDNDVNIVIKNSNNITDEYLQSQKEKRIKELEKNNSEIIYETYPIHKQTNIIGRINGYVDNDYNVMNTFITSKINECRNIENQINTCETIEEVEVVNVDLV